MGDLDPALAPALESVRDRAILVIDPDPEAHELIARILKSHGLRVCGARDAARGLEMARSVRPVLIAVEVDLPGGDGWQLLARLREDPATRTIPVIVVSLVHDPARALELGASACLSKPLERASFLQGVVRALDGDALEVAADRLKARRSSA